jgi:hypothetical protein
MDGWHSQRLLGNGEVGDRIIKVCCLFIYLFVLFSFGFTGLIFIVAYGDCSNLGSCTLLACLLV